MATKRSIDAGSEYLGADTTLEIGERPAPSEIIDTPVPTDAVAYEAFMNEVLTIMIPESTDENDTPLVEVGVNGRKLYIRRGVEQEVRRKYVAALARCKSTDYSQVTLDPRNGEAVNRLHRRQMLRYPFTVIADPNRNGHAWLRGVLAEVN